MTALWIIIALLVLLALGVLGAIVKGLLWLTAIAAVIFLVGALFGFVKFRGSNSV